MLAEKPTRLTAKNFHDILSMEDPWIVVFVEDYDKQKEIELVALATSVVGLVQIGFVNMDDADNDELIEAKVRILALHSFFKNNLMRSLRFC